MEFQEFKNPESQDYDIHSSFNESTNPYYADQLLELISIPEDVTEETLQEHYGISLEEYFHPTEETIQKVKAKLQGNESNKQK